MSLLFGVVYMCVVLAIREVFMLFVLFVID